MTTTTTTTATKQQQKFTQQNQEETVNEARQRQKEELLKQTIDLALLVHCSGRLHFWKSLHITADKRYSGEKFSIFLLLDYIHVKIYIISIEITMNANIFQSNKIQKSSSSLKYSSVCLASFNLKSPDRLINVCRTGSMDLIRLKVKLQKQ